MESPSRIEEAIAALRRGEAIGLPTETVYGLAADARDAAAVRRIFELKGRPADHPLIVHLAESGWLERWARDVPTEAVVLADRFWPGPMTLILQRQPDVLDAVTGGQDTVGLRVPAHPLARDVIARFGDGLAAPSANRYGRVSPTTAQHVRDEFGDSVPIVLDGGDCEVGIESTIVDLSCDAPRILRPGRITRAELEAAIGPVESGATAASPRTAGTHAAHYAPRTPIELAPSAELAGRIAAHRHAGRRVATLARAAVPEGAEGIAAGAAARDYAHALYAALRALDALGAERIVIETPPDGAEWTAIRDRLMRAAAGAPLDGPGT
ncbi:MAG TPA: L-threonylcarbamoyladenylate synthase [Xanthomonadales bacterium]|nr:L-threonylcarbamoyladenylate synthase [Xanthomonadales bacterium]